MIANKVPEHVWRPYLEALDQAVGGKVVEGGYCFAATASGSPPFAEQLFPHHRNSLISAIETAIRSLREDEA